MTFEFPPAWTAAHDQHEAELRDLVKPIVASMLVVRRGSDEEAVEEGAILAALMAEHIAPMEPTHVMELLFLACSKIASNALEEYDQRMERLYEQARAHASRDIDAGRDALGSEE